MWSHFMTYVTLFSMIKLLYFTLVLFEVCVIIIIIIVTFFFSSFRLWHVTFFSGFQFYTSFLNNPQILNCMSTFWLKVQELAKLFLHSSTQHKRKVHKKFEFSMIFSCKGVGASGCAAAVKAFIDNVMSSSSNVSFFKLKVTHFLVVERN